MTTLTPDGATVLGVVDGYEYLGVDWVFRRCVGASALADLDYYCTRAAWPDTPASQLAGRDQVIADLRVKVAELERELAAVVVADAATPAEPGQAEMEAAADAAPVDDAGGGRRKAPPAKEPCPDCGNLISPWQMGRHRQKHAARTVLLTVPAWPSAQIAYDSDEWRCAVCTSNAHTRSVKHPDRCLRCANLVSTNGHEVTA